MNLQKPFLHNVYERVIFTFFENTPVEIRKVNCITFDILLRLQQKRGRCLISHFDKINVRTICCQISVFSIFPHGSYCLSPNEIQCTIMNI